MIDSIWPICDDDEALSVLNQEKKHAYEIEFTVKFNFSPTLVPTVVECRELIEF